MNIDNGILSKLIVSRRGPIIASGASNKRTPPNRKVKKLPSALRKELINLQTESNSFRRQLLRLKSDSQYLRVVVQVSFLLLCVWIGIEFFYFARWGSSHGAELYVERPPGAEGFLPISAFMSLIYWIQTGIINDVHPAALFIFIGAITIALLLKKAFCSWMCPIGTMSESLWNLGNRIFGRTVVLPRWLDYPLRSLKYFLAFFFVYSISQMDITSLKAFIFSPYNKMADVKMWMFFSDITPFALRTLVGITVLSLFVRNLWCRYLCPYGALLGAISLLSPIKVTRKLATCIDCELCSKACSAGIKVHTARHVWNDECTGCLACVQSCPVKNTLEMKVVGTDVRVSNWVFGALIIGLFVGITGLAMMTGHWKNNISREEYLNRFPQINSPLYQHNRGSVPDYAPND